MITKNNTNVNTLLSNLVKSEQSIKLMKIELQAEKTNQFFIKQDLIRYCIDNNHTEFLTLNIPRLKEALS